MAKKRNKDKEASPGRSSKIARVSEKKKDVGKAREIEEIVVPVLAANTAKSARGMSTRGDGVCLRLYLRHFCSGHFLRFLP